MKSLMIIYIVLVVFNFLKIDLHEFLEFTPIVLIAFVCNLKILLTSVEEPQNIMLTSALSGNKHNIPYHKPNFGEMVHTYNCITCTACFWSYLSNVFSSSCACLFAY
jgi:hypothetical protein